MVLSRPLKAGTCLATTDGGKTWETHWIPTNFDITCLETATAPVMQIGNSGGEDHPDGDIFRSADSGKTWKSERCFRALFAIQQIEDKHWAAVGSSVAVGFFPKPTSELYTSKACRALYSEDAGVTWKVSKGSDGKGSLRGLAVQKGKSLLAVGDHGAILRSENKGVSWEVVPSNTKHHLTDVVRSEKIAIAVGKNGVTLVSADDGKSWKTASAEGAALHRVAVAGDTVIAVGDKGTVLRASIGKLAPMGAAEPSAQPAKNPVIDVHMHVWSDDPVKFPFAHPYNAKFTPPLIPASLDRVVKEMDELGVTHCVLVQTISHGWDNRYLFHCLKAHPKRFRGQGLIDPTDPRVAEKLALVMKEPGMAGVRFSPMYYQGKDDWLNAKASDALWHKADELGAIFNFYIASEQLPKLEDMVRRHPKVKVVIDHLAYVDLTAKDPEPDIKKLLALAKYPNVHVKVSELMILSPSKKYPYRDTYALVKKVHEAYGADRLLWGTGFPGATRAQADRPTLQQELALIQTEIPFFTAEERAKILGKNAAKLWGFDR